ncbi:MAG: glycerol-3-phosphate 1-O-acyltransferase PlsY [Sphingomonadales bacterium]|jgi:glycerol-3-phosphate acyltransferase PlsY
MTDPLLFISILLGGYVLGSIPFGLVLTKLAGLGDVRNIGSGNIGATNVLRTGHKGLAAATLLLDALKGAAPVLIAGHCVTDAPVTWSNAAALAGVGAFLGHIFPIWLKFKGGKGVATAIGVLAALNWLAALIAAAIWLATAVVFRISSLAALVACAVVPALVWFLGSKDVFIPLLFMVALIIWAHRANISRLLQGTEPKIGAK